MTEEEINKFFEEDLLKDRRQMAENISKIIEEECNDKKGFVLAINGEWGTGKTTFVGMLDNYLSSEAQNYRVINFNCWEKDFVEDPLIAMFAEMNKELGKKRKGYKKALKAIGKIALGAAVGAASEFVGEKTTKIIGEGIKSALQNAEDIANGYMDLYSEQVKSMDDFKNALKDYVFKKSDDCKKSQVVFIVDELDRCNPHYAVKVLERIKHLFDIPNLCFILPICKSQLEFAIKGYYGSENIDANNYLMRFIDLEIKLPVVNLLDYCANAIIMSGVVKFISNSTNYYNDSNLVCYARETAQLFEGTNTDLRSINKVLVHVYMVMKGRYGYDAYLPILLLCYLKFNNYELYDKIKRKTLSIEELLSEFDKYFYGYYLKNPNEPIFYYLNCLVASVLYVYSRRSSEKDKEIFLVWKSQNFEQLSTCFDKRKIAEELRNMNGYSTIHNVCIEELTKHIDNPLKNTD